MCTGTALHAWALLSPPNQLPAAKIQDPHTGALLQPLAADTQPALDPDPCPGPVAPLGRDLDPLAGGLQDPGHLSAGLEAGRREDQGVLDLVDLDTWLSKSNPTGEVGAEVGSEGLEGKSRIVVVELTRTRAGKKTEGGKRRRKKRRTEKKTGGERRIGGRIRTGMEIGGRIGTGGIAVIAEITKAAGVDRQNTMWVCLVSIWIEINLAMCFVYQQV